MITYNLTLLLLLQLRPVTPPRTGRATCCLHVRKGRNTALVTRPSALSVCLSWGCVTLQRHYLCLLKVPSFLWIPEIQRSSFHSVCAVSSARVTPLSSSCLILPIHLVIPTLTLPLPGSLPCLFLLLLIAFFSELDSFQYNPCITSQTPTSSVGENTVAIYILRGGSQHRQMK